jgi:FMN-dependent NADH-azoreductase
VKLLQVDSSARVSSVSRTLTARFAAEWKRENPDGQVLTRDLTTTPVPLITDEYMQAVHTDPAKLTPAGK